MIHFFADINIFATAMGGLSVLHDAVANNHNKVVRMLLEYGGMISNSVILVYFIIHNLSFGQYVYQACLKCDSTKG